MSRLLTIITLLFSCTVHLYGQDTMYTKGFLDGPYLGADIELNIVDTIPTNSLNSITSKPETVLKAYGVYLFSHLNYESFEGKNIIAIQKSYGLVLCEAIESSAGPFATESIRIDTCLLGKGRFRSIIVYTEVNLSRTHWGGSLATSLERIAIWNIDSISPLLMADFSYSGEGRMYQVEKALADSNDKGKIDWWASKHTYGYDICEVYDVDILADSVIFQKQDCIGALTTRVYTSEAEPIICGLRNKELFITNENKQRRFNDY